MKTFVLLVLALMGLLRPLTVNALSEEPQAKQAFLAAMFALENGETRSANETFSYTQSIKDDQGNKAIRRFDATKPDAPWTTLSVEGKDLTDLRIDWSVPLRLTASSLDTLAASYCEQTDSHWIFCAHAPVSLSAEGSSEQLEEDANQLAQEKLETRIWVDKQLQRFTKMQIRNREPFRPSTLAKVKRFEIALEFAQAWPEGPTVTVQASRRLEGSYGFFISIDEHLVQSVSDIVPVQDSSKSNQ